MGNLGGQPDLLTAGLSLPSAERALRSGGRRIGLRRRERERRHRLRRYAGAMGWCIQGGQDRLIGEVEGMAVTAYDDGRGSSVVELRAPGVLPVVVVRPRALGGSLAVVEDDGLTALSVGDADFDLRYEVRTDTPWLTRIVLDRNVRRALMSAPDQELHTRGDAMVGTAAIRLQPLDLFARVAALLAVVTAVPWEAYDDPTVTPTPHAVQDALRVRRLVPAVTLPSAPRG